MKVQIERIGVANLGLLSGLALTDYNEKILRTCLRLSSLSWIGLVDGKLACVWGLVPPSLMSNQAYIWLQTTEVAEDHQFLLVRHSQLMIEQMLEEYPSLTGHCLYGAERSIRWLRWLGAVFGEPTGKGIPFVIRKDHG